MDIWETIVKSLQLQKFADKLNFSLLNVNINITKDDHSKKFEYKDSSKSLTLNTAKLNLEEKQSIKQAFLSKKKYLLLKEDAKALIEDFQKKDTSSSTQKVLDFLANKIPAEDLPVWRAALYMKVYFEANQKDKTKRLKTEIMQKHGNRGKNIANLCSAGYLEGFLMPFYNILKETCEDERIVTDIFKNKYNDIVSTLPFTVFVSAQMERENIKNQIVKRKERGINLIYIHGIGKNNVEKIKEVITDLQKHENYKIVEQTITANDKIISVKFKSS